jgi:hypothetical protein
MHHLPVKKQKNHNKSLLIILLEVWSMARKYAFNSPKYAFKQKNSHHPSCLAPDPDAGKNSPTLLGPELPRKLIRDKPGAAEEA